MGKWANRQMGDPRQGVNDMGKKKKPWARRRIHGTIDLD
jgi:hypothetical protein